MLRYCVLGLVLVGGCGGSRTVGDLVQHFRAAGFEGEYTPRAAALVGAEDAGAYEGKDFSISLLRFADSSKAASLEKAGVKGRRLYRNGAFILSVSKDKNEDDIVAAFNKF